MTVQELITRLEQVPEDWVVLIQVGDDVPGCNIGGTYSSKYLEEKFVSVFQNGGPEVIKKVFVPRNALVLSSATDFKSCD